MSNRTCAVLGAAFASAVLIGCGSDSGSSSSGTGGGGGSTPQQIDACTIVTQGEATTLFGQDATKEAPTPVNDDNLLGQCSWTWDTATDNQLLQLFIWTDTAYEKPSDAQDYDIGDEGYVRLVGSVDVGWIQLDKSVTLSYSTVGTAVPDAETKAEAVKTLAQTASGKRE
jgi:hypothetical protein